MELKEIADEYNALLDQSRGIKFTAGSRPTSSDMWNMATLIVLDRKNNPKSED